MPAPASRRPDKQVIRTENHLLRHLFALSQGRDASLSDDAVRNASAAFGLAATLQACRRKEMQNININADQALWATNMLPEGIVERWFVAEGAIAHAGHSVAEVRIEGALHDIVSPVSGRLAIRAPAKNVIEPGSLLATVAVDTTPTSMK